MNIGRQVISSLKWMAVLRFSGQLINWVITIFVINLLQPEDYGLMSQAMIVMGLLALINEMGMGSALVQKEDVSKQVVSQVFGVGILLNTTVFIIILLLAPLIAIFFDEPSLRNIMYVVAISFLINSFLIIPNAMLSRTLAFKKKATVDLVTMLAASFSTLILAFQGFGVWALVAGNIVGSVSRVVGINLVARYWVFPSFNFAGMRKIFTFGGTVTADRVLWYLYSQSDTIIVGKLLGKELLGFYTVSMQLASLPMQKLSGMVNEVGFAAFSRTQSDAQQFSAHFTKAARLLCVFAFPVFWGISAVTPEIVLIFLGEQWQPAIVPMQILSLVIPIRMLSSIASPALAGIGRPDVSIKNLIIASIIMPVAFLIGVNWGLLGVALAWAIAYPVTFCIMQYRALRVLEVSIKEYLKEVSRPIFPAILMYLFILLVRAITSDWNGEGIFYFIFLITVGALTFGLSLLTLQKPLCHEVLKVMKR